MSKQWMGKLATAVLGASCLVAAGAGSAAREVRAPEGFVVTPETGQASLTAVQVDADPAGRAVVRLSADGQFDFESFVLDGPDRLVLDLSGVVSRLDASRVQIGRGGVARVRAAQHRLDPTPVTRVVFDLTRPIGYRIEETDSGLAVVFGDDLPQAAARPKAESPDGIEIAVPAEPPVEAAADRPEDVQQVVDELAARSVVPAEAVPTGATAEDRSIEPDVLDRLLKAPAFAAPQEEAEAPALPPSFETRRIVTDAQTYSGKRISLNLVDADLKQIFRLFHEISGLNFVLDPDVNGRVTIVLDQVPWDQALDIILKNNGLDKNLENNVVRIATTQKLAQEAASRKQLKEAEELAVEPVTLTRTLSYAKAKDVQRVIREGGILSGRGKVIVDERTNTLIISDVPAKVEPLDSLLTALDSETPQVMIEARIVETSKTYTRDLGIVWGVEALADAAHGTATGLSFPHNVQAKYGLNLPGESGASNLAFNFGNIVDSFTLDVALNALENEGNARILSSPKIATQNNERAEIEQGVRIPVVNTTATEINVEFVSASLLLIVTPQITAEGTIILDVVVENNSPDFVNTAGGIPSIRTQRAQTKVLITDGGTTVIGGIFTVNEGQSEIGVPWFRKLPIFGWLFRSQNITQENRELLIFITPKIVKLG